jgi:2-aminoadipate transaminase
VPCDDDGLDPEAAAALAARHGARLLYTVPTFQNPTGRTLPLARREALVDLAARGGLWIVEDDPYGELRFEGEHLPSLRSFWPEGVIYLGTFSKILAPGFRLGWIVTPAELYDDIVFAKQPADLHTSTASQMATYEVCKDGFVDRHVERIKDLYRERRDVMLRALEAHFPPGCSWTKAQGGLFVWAELPLEIDTSELMADAIAENVAFVPGRSFHPDRSGHNTMRLNFSNVTPDRIEEGIARLGRAIKRRLAQQVDTREQVPVSP